jgi:Carboxypeptidase regulatory-like domain
MVRLARPFFSCIINLLFFAIVHAQSPTERTASISGRVMVDGKPAVNAQVTAVEIDPKNIKEVRIFQSNGREFVDRLGYRASTNADGIYLFTGLPAGKYKVSAMSNVYIPVNKAQADDPSRQITLDEGEAREKVDFALIRGGVITGRVTDDENSPQIEMRVWMTEVSGNGQIINNASRHSSMTDDRGLYRIYGIRPGRYLISTGGLHNRFHGKQFELTYHPHTTSLEQAQVIEVKEGGEVAGLDIRLVNTGKSYEVQGRVIEAETGKAVPQIRVQCIAVSNQDDDYGNSVTDGLTDGQGNFHLTGVRSGKYKIRLHSWNTENPFYAEGKYFEIDSDNVNGLELKINRGGTISGMVLLEEGKDRAVEAALYQSTVVVSIRHDFQQGSKTVASKNKPVSPDGSFLFIGIPPGKAHFGISNSNISLYLLRVEHDGSAQSDGIHVKPGENISGVKLIADHGDGIIRGQVKIVGGNLPECCKLFAWATHSLSFDFSKSADVDEKGRFLIEGLLAGSYTLQIHMTNKLGFDTRQMSKLPEPVTQNISVASGTETRVTITYDLSRIDQ